MRRLAEGRHQFGNAHALAALHQKLREGERHHQRPLALRRLSAGGIVHGRREIRPDPHRVARLPLALADIKMIVAGGAAPVHAIGRLAVHETAVLPEILTRARAPTPVQAVLHAHGDAARLQHEARHGCREVCGGEGGRLNGVTLRVLGRAFLWGVGHGSGHGRGPVRAHPSRSVRRRMMPVTLWRSARAAKVSAMRCFSTGSARATTSSREGA